MDDLVFKMNYVKNNNELVKLRNDIKKKDETMRQFTKNCKNLVESYKINSNIKMAELKEIIVDLDKQNKKLTSERDSYRYSLNRVPNFLLRLFGAKRKALGAGKE